MTPDAELKADLYKACYERAAQRYENLYNAVWTNFSYMSVIAAGILSFAADKLYFPPLLLVALLPLLFWYQVTYKPLDRYGDDALGTLSDMETRISSEFGVNIDHFSKFRRYRESNPQQRVAFSIQVIMILMFWTWIGVAVFCAWKLSIGHSLTKGADTNKMTITLPDAPVRVDISRRP